MLNSPSDKSQFNEETIQNCFTVEVSHNQHEVSELTTPHLCLHECGPCTNVHGRKSWSIELGSSKSTTYQWRSFWPLLGNCLLEASTSKIDIEELEDNHWRCNTFIPTNPVLGPWLQGKFQARSPCFSPGMVNASHRLAMAQIWQFLWLFIWWFPNCNLFAAKGHIQLSNCCQSAFLHPPRRSILQSHAQCTQ